MSNHKEQVFLTPDGWANVERQVLTTPVDASEASEPSLADFIRLLVEAGEGLHDPRVYVGTYTDETTEVCILGRRLPTPEELDERERRQREARRKASLVQHLDGV